VKISSQYVSTILSNARRKKGRRVRATAAASNGRGGGIDVAQLVKAKQLVRKLGGIDQAKKMIDALAKILD
jgi:geranylgeranyl pyrophosphate synthase